jgi:hypothetical protein
MATWAECKKMIEEFGVKDDEEIAWVEFMYYPGYAKRTPGEWGGHWIIGD